MFELPAGAVNVAFGGEFRRQRLEQLSNVDPTAPIALLEPGLSERGGTPVGAFNGVADGLRTAANAFNLLWNSTNVGKSFGKQDIKEVYGEVAVPILRDVTMFQALDLNAAARYVDYSVTGSLWAWKLGGSWTPVDDVRFAAPCLRISARPRSTNCSRASAPPAAPSPTSTPARTPT